MRRAIRSKNSRANDSLVVWSSTTRVNPPTTATTTTTTTTRASDGSSQGVTKISKRKVEKVLESRRIGTEFHGEPYRRALPGYPPGTSMGGAIMTVRPSPGGMVQRMESLLLFSTWKSQAKLSPATCWVHPMVWDWEASAVPSLSHTRSRDGKGKQEEHCDDSGLCPSEAGGVGREHDGGAPSRACGCLPRWRRMATATRKTRLTCLGRPLTLTGRSSSS